MENEEEYYKRYLCMPHVLSFKSTVHIFFHLPSLISAVSLRWCVWKVKKTVWNWNINEVIVKVIVYAALHSSSWTGSFHPEKFGEKSPKLQVSSTYNLKGLVRYQVHIREWNVLDKMCLFPMTNWKTAETLQQQKWNEIKCYTSLMYCNVWW